MASFTAGAREVITVWFGNGELWTKNPSEAAITAMLGLAVAPGARVRGDEGETYRTAQETYEHPDDRAAGTAGEARVEDWARKTKTRRILVNGILFALFVVLGLVAAKYSGK